MLQFIEVERKTHVLKHPTLACLSQYHTINLLSGCPYECRYCYTQSFRSHPGWGKLVFYANTFQLLQKQLPRMRVRPRLVYFSTACEPFTPHEAVLHELYEVMRLLLKQSVSILISTKSLIPTRFLELFNDYPEQVHVQVGLTTPCDSVRQSIEPNAPSVAERLNNLDQLRRTKISYEVRADPLIPELTDTDENVSALFQAVSEREVRQIVMSYLFLRPANVRPLQTLKQGAFSFSETAEKLFTETISNYCGNNPVRVVRTDYRKARYARFCELAKKYNLMVRLCRCKNPTLTEQCCHPQFTHDAKSGEQMVMPFGTHKP